MVRPRLETKKCPVCGITKPRNEFYTSRGRIDHPECKTCYKQLQRTKTVEDRERCEIEADNYGRPMTIGYSHRPGLTGWVVRRQGINRLVRGEAPWLPRAANYNSDILGMSSNSTPAA